MLNLGDGECQVLLQTLWNQSITGLALVAEDGRFLQANPSFCRMLEYTEVELRAKKFQDVTDPDDVAADVEMARAVAAGEYASYDMTKAYYTKTKKHQPVLLRVTGMRMNGKFTCFISEVAPLDRAAERAVAAPRRPAGEKLLRLIKEYWVQIVFVLGCAADIADRVVNHK